MQEIGVNDKILETYKAFYDKKNGFYALRHQIQEAIRNEEQLKQLYNHNTKEMCSRWNIVENDAKNEQIKSFSYGVFFVIKQLEDSGVIRKDSKTLDEQEKVALQETVINKVSEILKATSDVLQEPNIEQNNFIRQLSRKVDLGSEDIRFAFTPEQIAKYHFGYGCHHCAIGFININKSLSKEYLIKDEDFKLILSTRWNNLHDGLCGHVVPCVKKQDGYYAFDPQREPDYETNKINFITPAYSNKAKGQTIFHVLKGHAGVPYMITTDLISPSEYKKYCKNYQKFIHQYSKVKRDDAIKFLNKQVEMEKLTSDQVNNFIKEYDNYTEKRKEKLRDATKQTATSDNIATKKMFNQSEHKI